MVKQHSIGHLIDLSAGYLGDKGCSSPRLDAELLLGHVLGLDRLDLYLNLDKPLNDAEVDEYRGLIGRRGAAYSRRLPYRCPRILFAAAWGNRRCFNPPRPETEFLVDKVLEMLEPGVSVEILELGTGSGAVAVALAYQDPNIKVTATDISPQALQVAKITRPAWRWRVKSSFSKATYLPMLRQNIP